MTGIARAAGVNRTFLYRHRDLLEQIHALEAQPRNGASIGPAVSWASLQADLLNAQARATRMAARVQQLEKRLSEALGEQVWRQSASALPTTSTRSSSESSPSNNRSSTYEPSLKNATTNSPPPAPPTEN
ncbi:MULTISPECIES: hypothetical protein [Micromonospora]|uniref:hypothetical protein n=1 Tax=Micromonospora TaxID=1873 RepID=UPI00195918E4|nr:hypothetical protein [Micromonospora globbae]